MRVVNLIAERPDWIVGVNVRVWRVLAHLAEKAGEWRTATAAWREAAAETDDLFQRAGLLVAAAATAGVGGDRELHDTLLGEARELAPDHPRVRVQEVDQSLGGAERLAALEGVESADPPVTALIASHRALAHLLLGEVEEARDSLVHAQEANPQSALVRMVALNVTVQQARLDSTAHRRLDYSELMRAYDAAMALLDDLRNERRYDETVRILMLASDIRSMIGEHKKARSLLMSATADELATRDAAEVLGDAALRALGWEEALKLTEGADETPMRERIRACALGEIGSPREREEAIATLDRLVADGGAEAPQAAIYRLGLVTARQPAEWSDEAAEVLRQEGYEAPADVAQAFLLDRVEDDPAEAPRLLDEHGDEMWALLAKLRLAGMRGDNAVMAEAAGALLDRGPAQDVVIEAARALAMGGDREQARRLFLTVARDQACPPAIRADAYAHLIPLLADVNDWEAAHTLHVEWIDVRSTDDRAYPWAPTIANRRARAV
jgi:tetratricopeptide (TPR) repeat protein